MNKKTRMTNFRFSALLSMCALAFTACPDVCGMPTYPVRVLGFASTCGQGASVKIIHDTHPKGEKASMLRVESIDTSEQEQVEIGLMPAVLHGPFTVRVGVWSCPFTSSDGIALEEVTCVREDSAPDDGVCLARLNFQGTRSPTLPPYSDTAWQSWEEGSWSPTPADALFAEPDLDTVRAFDELQKEQVRNRY